MQVTQREALAWQNARSDRVCLDLLVLFDQAKRTDKKNDTGLKNKTSFEDTASNEMTNFLPFEK